MVMTIPERPQTPAVTGMLSYREWQSFAHLNHLNKTRRLTTMERTAYTRLASRLRQFGADKNNDQIPDQLVGVDRDAYVALNGLLASYGLQSLAPTVLKFIQQGYSEDTITILLEQTPAYKARFAANEIRRKNGLAVLSPAEYLSVEAAYRQILSAAGLPKGFYDSVNDFTNWIAKDVSPQELQGRVGQAVKVLNESPPQVLQQLRAYYPELGKGDLVAYALDQKRALPILEQQIRAAEIGAAGALQGFQVSKATAEKYGQMLSFDQAQQAYQEVGQALPDTKRLAAIYHQTYNQADAEAEFLGGLESARRKRRTLAELEQASFAGAGGVGETTFKPKAAGSY